MSVMGDIEARYAERFPGWKRSRSSSTCPRVVAGKRCFAWSGRWRPGRCICQKHGYPLLDHTRLWVMPDKGGHCFTSDSYHIDEKDLEAFRADCADLGLQVVVEDYSPWFPGNTQLILVTRKEVEP